MLILIALAAVNSGCRDDSARVAAVAQQALEVQSKQNAQLAKLSGEVVESSQQLVTQDAQARTQILAAQRDLQTQQTALGRQRDDLEAERRRLAAQRRTESVLGPIAATLGAAFLCLLPLGIAGYALYLSRGSVPEMEDVGQILLEELVSDCPKLLPPPAASPPAPRLEPPADRPGG